LIVLTLNISSCEISVRAAPCQKTQDLDLPGRERPENELGLLAGACVLGDGPEVAGFSPSVAHERHGQLGPDLRIAPPDLSLLGRVTVDLTGEHAVEMFQIFVQVAGMGYVFKG
jgi:hypothetical protein